MNPVDFEQAGVPNLQAFLAAMRDHPERVLLAASLDDLRKGVPIAEVLRPPYGVVYLATGIVLAGHCSVCEERLWMGTREDGVAIVRTEGRQDDRKPWVPVKKDGWVMKIYFPNHGYTPLLTPVVRRY